MAQHSSAVARRHGSARRIAAAVGAAALLAGGLVGLAASEASADTTTCVDFGSTKVNGGRYVVQNNRWGTSAEQCIAARDGGFTLTRADGSVPTNGAPKSYPSIYAGCHYTNCSSGSGLPIRANTVNGSATGTIRTAGGEWDAAYDIWFDSSPNPSGQNNGTEIMVWSNHQGAPRPAGSKVADVTLDGASYALWNGRLSNAGIAWNVVSFVRNTPTTNIAINLKPFVDESIRRGTTNADWYMTSVQFGFEPWVGGAGLSVDGFSYSPGSQQPPPPPSSGQSFVGRGSNRCLDVDGGRNADGTKVQLWDCYGNGAQGWAQRGQELVNTGSGKCLDVAGGQTANGTQVRLWSCNGTGAQRWVVNGNGTIVNPASGKCLDAVERGTANGTPVQIWDCYGNGVAPNQAWTRR